MDSTTPHIVEIRTVGSEEKYSQEHTNDTTENKTNNRDYDVHRENYIPDVKDKFDNVIPTPLQTLLETIVSITVVVGTSFYLTKCK